MTTMAHALFADALRHSAVPPPRFHLRQEGAGNRRSSATRSGPRHRRLMRLGQSLRVGGNGPRRPRVGLKPEKLERGRGKRGEQSKEREREGNPRRLSGGKPGPSV